MHLPSFIVTGDMKIIRKSEEKNKQENLKAEYTNEFASSSSSGFDIFVSKGRVATKEKEKQEAAPTLFLSR